MFDPVDLYQFAGNLYRQNSGLEAEQRTIINRAYYSAFLSAKRISKIKNSSGSVHNEVIVYFAKRPNRNISNQLLQLKVLRQVADYDLDSIITSRQAGQSLKLASQILKELNHLT